MIPIRKPIPSSYQTNTDEKFSRHAKDTDRGYICIADYQSNPKNKVLTSLAEQSHTRDLLWDFLRSFPRRSPNFKHFVLV